MSMSAWLDHRLWHRPVIVAYSLASRELFAAEAIGLLYACKAERSC